MNIDPKLFQPLANLSLWFKMKAGDSLSLADVPRIIPLRWTYFLENYSFIKKSLLPFVSEYADTDQLSQQLDDLDEFIQEHKASVFKNSNPFADQSVLYRFYSVFENVLIDSLAVSEEERRILDDLARNVFAYSRADFLELRKQITEVRDLITDHVGLSDDTYNSIKGRLSTTRNLTPDYKVLFQLKTIQEAIKAVDYILANEFSSSTTVDPFAITRANLKGADVPIGSYNSGYLVPFNYGDTLEKVAMRYLGSAEKWLDIAIANGLKPPYVDEVGFAIDLKSDGFENTIVIDGVTGEFENIKRLYLNQPIFLSSSTILVPEQRAITGIREIDSNSILLELDGALDLEQYTLDNYAQMRAYKTATINSNSFILIPRAGPPNSITSDQDPYFIQSLGAAEKNAKVDLALSDDGDLQFTSTGDFKLSYGLANALQALKLKLSVELGALKRHSNFGLVNVIGQSNTDISAAISTLTQSIDQQVRMDPRFDRVENMDVTFNGATIEVELSVRLAGSSTIIPIIFKVSNS